MSDLEKLIDDLKITPEELIYSLATRGKIDIATVIKFHMKEITLEEILKSIKNHE